HVIDRLCFSITSPTTEIYTLSLHDALPIYRVASRADSTKAERFDIREAGSTTNVCVVGTLGYDAAIRGWPGGLLRLAEVTPALRSEEHTSELQSRENLVCRLLLEKKK